jgi:hypothetical protein
MTTAKSKTAKKSRTADSFPPDPWSKYDHWDDGVMSIDADQLLRRMFVQFESGQTAPRLLRTLEFWAHHFATEKISNEPVISPERMHRFVGDARDFALVQDADGKPVERDDPRNAELKAAGPKRKARKAKK